MDRLPRWAPCALVLVALALPAAVSAQCTRPVLVSDSLFATSAAASTWSFESGGAWGAVGVRSAAGSHHDLTVFQSIAGPPACVAGALGASGDGDAVEVVVGDFRAGRNPAGSYFPRVVRTLGTGECKIEWDRGDTLVVDAPPVVRETNQLVDAYQVFLEAGVSYFIDFKPAPGIAAKLLIFRNPSVAPYWAGRASALSESTGPTHFTAAGSDAYCFVVVNDDGGASGYSLAVDQCQPPIALTSGLAETTIAPQRYQMSQAEPYWSAVGVRGAGGDEWNVIGYKSGSGALEPTCFKDSICASSQPAPAVDFIAADFNFNPVVPYFARMVQAAGTAAGVVEWDSGPDELELNAAPVERTTGPADVLETWDAYLEAGTSYTIFFERSGAANTRFLVFENAAQSGSVPYWSGRAGAVASGTAHAGYTPLTGGYHGIVVVNDNGAAGTYRIALYGAQVGVAPAHGPERATLDALTPNPAFARTSIAYSLPRAGRVAFDVIDVSGRRVESVGPFEAPAGPGRAQWDGRAGGSRARPGVYFVRMTFDGRRSGLAKLVLLP